MSYFHADRAAVLGNGDFRRVVYTGAHVQVLFVCVPPGEEIGEEVHEEHDQTFVFVAGEGKMAVGAEKVPVHPGDIMVIPVGVYHNLKSLGPGDLKLYSLCTPPHHPSGTVHRSKADAVPHQEH